MRKLVLPDFANDIVNETLISLKSQYTLPTMLNKRIDIVLNLLEHGIRETALNCNCSRVTVQKWERRIRESLEKLDRNHSNKAFIKQVVLAALSDAQRSGRPDIYTAEQVCRIIKLATEDPDSYGYPISNWSIRELTLEIRKQDIAPMISESTIFRILNKIDLKPHKSTYWLNANKKDGDFEERVAEVCNIYKNAQSYNEMNVRVVSVDEKTGIQALERIAPDKSVKARSYQKLEVEYKRHGTLCLMPSFDVATGCIIEYSLGETRNELDFSTLIKKTVETDKHARWIFIADQLNTHKSETLVRLVAKDAGIPESELGKKGECGILKNMNSRMGFLEAKNHRIRFFYTPKHSSWLNQIEIWFGIISRKLLRRLSSASTQKLKEKISEFITYFNKTMSKPFKWTYQGKTLQA